MAYRVTLIPGDGTGPEIVEVTRRVLESTGVQLEWEAHDAGDEVLAREGTPLPDSVLDSIRKNKSRPQGHDPTAVGTSQFADAVIEAMRGL